ncbi:MAG: glycosyltransferase [Candidatus Zixiibacteriota bacterium]
MRVTEMKILHVFKEYHPVVGGIQNHIRVLSGELAKDNDFDVEVLVTNTGSKTVTEYTDGVKVVKAARVAKIASTPISFSLFRFLRKARPDILHLHFPYPLGELASLLFGCCDRIVLTYHSDIVRQNRWLLLYMPILKQVLGKVRIIVASNPNNVRSSALLSKYADKTEIIPYGIDVQRFERANERKVQEIRSRCNGPIVLFVGRLCYYKGIKYLLEASREIDAKFLLIGDGPHKLKLMNLVRGNKLAKKIVWLGEVSEDDLVCYYHAADLLVLPSIYRSEAFGLVLLEGMACGLPLITTELGTGTSFVNCHNRTGLVVPPSDSVALQQAISYLLNNEDVRLRFSQNARERVRRVFSKAQMVESIRKLYFRVLNS